MTSRELQQRIDRYLTSKQRLDDWDREAAAAEGVVDDDDEDEDLDDDEDLDGPSLTAEDLAALDLDDDEDLDDGDDGDDERSYASMKSELDYATKDLHGALAGKAVRVNRGRTEVALIPRGDGSIEIVELSRP